MTPITFLTRLDSSPLTTISQAAILYHCIAKAPTQQDICIALQAPAPRVTRTVDRLVELGLVERQQNRMDRKVSFVVATARGRALAKRWEEDL